MSLPYMKFFPSDWRGATGLKLVSMAARGLWIEMICVMHEADPYGHLMHAGKPLAAKGLAALVGAPQADVEGWLQELVDMDVVKVKRNGVFYSKRMEDDENRRRRASENGKKGGRPSAEKEREIKDTLKGHEKGDDHPHEESETRDQSPETREEESSLRSVAPSPKGDLILTPEAGAVSGGGSAAPGTALAVVKTQVAEITAKGTRLSPDWAPSETDLAYALEHGFTARPAMAMAENFRDYWIAQAGARARKANWPATWRTWVRNQEQRGGRNGSGNRPHRQEQNAQDAYAASQELFGRDPGDDDYGRQ